MASAFAPAMLRSLAGSHREKLPGHNEPLFDVRSLVGVLLGVDAADPHEPGWPGPRV